MMRTRSTPTLVGLGILLTVLLTACAGLPTAGPVNAGQAVTDAETDGDFVFIPDGPAPNATPQQIVEGFIAAGSGPRGNWDTAREFLAEDFRTVWKPQAGVTVYRPGERSLTEVTEDEFVLSVTPVATVDDTGALSTVGDDGEIPLAFTLAMQPDGQWRITEAADGIVLDQNRFRAVFGSYALMFFDPTWTYLVPDERWFPKTYAATSIAQALVGGSPSPWLDGAVATSFVDGARLAQPAVPVRSGRVAEVSLEEGARSLEPTVLSRMQAQLEASLLTAGITGVDMFVDDQMVAAVPAPARSTRVDTRPLVQTADAFGFLSGAAIEEIDGLSAALTAMDAVHIDVNAERTAAAVLAADGAIVEVRSDGTELVVDERPGVLAPSIDPLGFVWSVPADAPTAVSAAAPDGTVYEIAAAWSGAVRIMSMRVSRDGTRVAAVVRDGTRDALWVAGILRDRNGVPTALGVPEAMAVVPGTGVQVAWSDAGTVSVLYALDGATYLWDQPLGGFGSFVRTPDGVTAVAGGNQSGAARLRDVAGDLYVQSGVNWQHLASGVQVLATQQGSPR
ncbi:LpqB family beta-propeller domain-containing protein [uncultured Microbacterium sp.]|uniref:LpqB family beta-propeller domain-containing protein n=1 Tax=uncultured Microbacterium sp. TaxID=191216 RepID=UPI002614C6CD|nr:LpqB family beta-propeller domain-containing protein [uncultured Microbacterium sp.]